MSRLTDEQTIQVRINTAVDEALSANNAKWRDKANYLITFYRDKAKGEVFRERYRYESMAVALENLLSQMEEE